jgi:hypothetical protein
VGGRAAAAASGVWTHWTAAAGELAIDEGSVSWMRTRFTDRSGCDEKLRHLVRWGGGCRPLYRPYLIHSDRSSLGRPSAPEINQCERHCRIELINWHHLRLAAVVHEFTSFVYVKCWQQFWIKRRTMVPLTRSTVRSARISCGPVITCRGRVRRVAFRCLPRRPLAHHVN